MNSSGEDPWKLVPGFLYLDSISFSLSWFCYILFCCHLSHDEPWESQQNWGWSEGLLTYLSMSIIPNSLLLMLCVQLITNYHHFYLYIFWKICPVLSILSAFMVQLWLHLGTTLPGFPTLKKQNPKVGGQHQANTMREVISQSQFSQLQDGDSNSACITRLWSGVNEKIHIHFMRLSM